MQLKELYGSQDIQEGKIADYAKGAAAGAAIGAGILTTMLPKQNTTQPASQPTTQPTSQPTSQPATQPDDSNLAAQFPGEYDIIKRAADRNGCIGDGDHPSFDLGSDGSGLEFGKSVDPVFGSWCLRFLVVGSHGSDVFHPDVRRSEKVDLSQ